MDTNYIKPVCHCGTALVFAEDYYYREQRRINEQGFLAERKMKQSLDDKYVVERYLRCPSCTHQFQYDFDDQGRVKLVGEIVGGFLISGQKQINRELKFDD